MVYYRTFSFFLFEMHFSFSGTLSRQQTATFTLKICTFLYRISHQKGNTSIKYLDAPVAFFQTKRQHLNSVLYALISKRKQKKGLKNKAI